MFPRSSQGVTIGRSSSSTIRILRPLVSRRHALLTPIETGVFEVIDLGSMNGTSVDGMPAAPGVLLRHGGTLGLGPYLFRFIDSEAPPLDCAEEPDVTLT